jgi:hypothetical protein
MSLDLQGMGASWRGLSPRDQRALRLGGIVLGGALLWLGVVGPVLGLVRELEARVDAEASLLVRERGVLVAAPALPERAESLRVELERWDARMVRSPNLALAEAETTALLQALARENRVLLEEARAAPRPPGAEIPEGLEPIRLALRGESDFEGVLGFLAALEADPLLLRIVALSIQRDGAEASSVVKIQAVVEAFAPAEVPAGPGGAPEAG